MASEPQLLELHYPSLVGGCAVTSPPRSNLPGTPYIWRASQNMIERDGIVRARPGIYGDGTPLPPTFTIGSRDEDGELPRHIFAAAAVNTDFLCVVTDRQLHVRPNTTGGWKNVTPTYTTGTVTATNGSKTVTGAGTAFSARGITKSQWIEIPTGSGDWYDIDVVNSDTQLTLFDNFTGTTGGGLSYTIRRTFPGGGAMISSRLLFAMIYNENLYVAGTYIGGADTVVRPAVIKVADIYSTTPTTTYLTAATALSVGLDTISGLSRIVGIVALQDGRVVLAGNFNEAIYSSNLNDAVWTTAPGGTTPMADMASYVEALAKMGDDCTFHFSSGIVWGHPTGLADPPLAFKRSGAGCGTIAPMTLRAYLGGQAFLASDGDAKFFDGTMVRSLGGGEFRQRQVLDTTGASKFSRSTYANYHAQVYEGRNEYVIFRHGTSPMLIWTYQAEGDRWWSGQSRIGIGAMSGSVEFAGITADRIAILGLQNELRWYREGVADDLVGGQPGVYELETDDLDHGMPLFDKTPHSLIVWPVADMTSLVVGVRRSIETSYDAAISKLLSLTAGVPKIAWFYPGQLAGIKASNAHRYKLSGETLVGGLFAIMVRAVPGDAWEMEG